MKKLFLLVLCVGLVGLLLPGNLMAATEEDKQQAIDDGLAWLASTQQTNGRWEYGDTRSDLAATASAALAFIEEGFLPNDGSIYGATVGSAVDWIFSGAQAVGIGMQIAGHPEDYDNNGTGDGNSQAIQFYSNDIYSNGITVPVIYALGEQLGQGTAVGGSNPVSDLTYSQLMQDVVDWFSWGQVEPDRGVYRGGWRYLPNYPTSDNSTAQWGALPLLYAADWGLGVPDFVFDELELWVNYIQNANGGSGYDNPNNLVNVAKTGGLLLELAAIGAPIGDPRVQAALSYINANWNTFDNNTWDGNLNHPYAMWAVYKGLQVYGLLGPYGPDPNDFMIGSGMSNAPGGITIGFAADPQSSAAGDWYSHYSGLLEGYQNANGSWTGYANWTGPLATGWNINILNATGAPPPSVPEPASMLLLGVAMLGIAGVVSKRRKKR